MSESVHGEQLVRDGAVAGGPPPAGVGVAAVFLVACGRRRAAGVEGVGVGSATAAGGDRLLQDLGGVDGRGGGGGGGGGHAAGERARGGGGPGRGRGGGRGA